MNRMTYISLTQLLVEIERAAVDKQSDLLNKVKLFEAVQEIDEPIRRFVSRLQILAYACNFTTKCPSQPCTASNVEATILLLMVKGLVDVDIQGELFAEVDQMDLETTIAFVEIRETDQKDASSARLPIPVTAVNPRRQPEEVFEYNSVTVMHSTRRGANSNLCQYMVSGKEFENKQALRKELETRTNVTLQNEEHDVRSNKYIQKKPAPAPKIKVVFKLEIQAYKSLPTS